MPIGDLSLVGVGRETNLNPASPARRSALRPKADFIIQYLCPNPGKVESQVFFLQY
jgi:hypothetical protein